MLDGRVAIVTGGGRGLGRAHCLALADAGAAVVVNDLGAGLHGEQTTESPADEVVAEIIKAGGRAVANHGSVSDWTAAQALVQQAADEFGRLDIVVNNAGIVRDRMVFSMTEADFDSVVGVHLKGTFAVSRHACAYWRAAAKRGEHVTGRIVNTTSGTGLFGNAGQANYGAAKAGIANLTVITAIEMRKYGVTANAVSPLAATRMTAGLPADSAAAATGFEPRDPDAADGFDPRDPANASGVVVYLASAEAGWLTGQILRVDGATVNRLRGWTVVDSYRGAPDAAVTAAELADALPQLYGVAPTGRVSTYAREA